MTQYSCIVQQYHTTRYRRWQRAPHRETTLGQVQAISDPRAVLLLLYSTTTKIDGTGIQTEYRCSCCFTAADWLASYVKPWRCSRLPAIAVGVWEKNHVKRLNRTRTIITNNNEQHQKQTNKYLLQQKKKRKEQDDPHSCISYTYTQHAHTCAWKKET